MTTERDPAAAGAGSGDRRLVVIASPLEPEQVRRIADFAPDQVAVAYAPELLPEPRYLGDHTGRARRLTAAEQARWRALLARAEILFDFDWQAPADLPARAPRLVWVQGTSAGIGELVRRNRLLDAPFQMTTAAGVHGTGLAEFALLGLLHFTLDVPGLRRLQAARRWQRHTSRALAGRRVLLVGLGSVGRAIARKLAAVDLEVWGIRRSDGGACPAGVARLLPAAELAGALAAVDALVLACPLTAATRGMIGAAELARLPPGAILVNVARGQVIDEPALIEALRAGHLAGAALDVFGEEPLPADSPLWALDNVLISPHSASTLADENRRIVDLFLANLERFLDGRPLLNRFDPARGY